MFDASKGIKAVRQLVALTVFVLIVGPVPTTADEVKYYKKDGVTYRECRRIVHRPVTETQIRKTSQTVYRQQQTSEVREQVRTWWSPVTEYQCEPYLVGRWNPLVKPYFSSRMVPKTRWEQRTEIVQVPVTRCQLVPESRIVETPVTVRRLVPEETISRMAVRGPSPAALSPLQPTPRLTAQDQIGGVKRLDNDPPRQGVDTAWRPSATSR